MWQRCCERIDNPAFTGEAFLKPLIAPERYEGSQFPEGDDALEEFFCQMTPNKGNSHFMFQEMNNGEIADLVETWLKEHNL